MIISHKYGFIYIKTRKTASTSLEIYLSQFCGDYDVITPVILEDEIKRRDLNIRGSQNYGITKTQKEPLTSSEYKINYQNIFYNHIPASKVREIVGENIWRNYYKFTFERNPWDKMVSLYYFDPRGYQSNMEFRDFVLKKINVEGMDNWPLYADVQEKKVILDKVFDYVDIQKNIDEINKKFSFKPLIKFDEIKAKSKYRKGYKRNYQDIYDDDTKLFVEKNFSSEIKEMGYTF